MTATSAVADVAASAPGLQRADTEGELIPQPAIAAGLATLIAVAGLQLPTPADWMASWRGVADLAVSLWLLAFFVTLPALWLMEAVLLRWRGVGGPPGGVRNQFAGVHRRPAAYPGGSDPSHTSLAALGTQQDYRPAPSRRLRAAWPAVLLLVCAFELALHHGERNPFVATSRPDAGVEAWTTADGYALLLDGQIAQGDGAFLLPMLELFLGEKPPSASEFDRRAGHVYLVSLLTTPFGAYWAFAGLNLLCWWAASVAIWWLGERRWPGTLTPWVGSLLTATGHGFVFMAAAPQAHAPAFAAFALLLALIERLGILVGGGSLTSWARLGWAVGASGLIYLVHLPALLLLWLGGAARARIAGLLIASAAAIVVVLAWERLGGAVLGLKFSGGNNDLAGEALGGWLHAGRNGAAHLVGQLRASSLRGLLGGAFWYPWWAFAALGWWASNAANRRWTLTVIVAGALPAIAFTTRFNLPRVAYFMFPAIYLLCGAGATAVCRAAPSRAAGRVAVAGLVAALVVLTNADVFGYQQLYLWFHYSQGNQW